MARRVGGSVEALDGFSIGVSAAGASARLVRADFAVGPRIGQIITTVLVFLVQCWIFGTAFAHALAPEADSYWWYRILIGYLSLFVIWDIWLRVSKDVSRDSLKRGARISLRIAATVVVVSFGLLALRQLNAHADTALPLIARWEDAVRATLNDARTASRSCSCCRIASICFAASFTLTPSFTLRWSPGALRQDVEWPAQPCLRRCTLQCKALSVRSYLW